jgi:hypothetical protein
VLPEGFWDWSLPALVVKKEGQRRPSMGRKLCRIRWVPHALADPKSAPIVHGKHAGTVALPYRCRAASVDTAAMLFWVWLASGPIKMRKNSACGWAKTGNRAKSQNAAKQTPGALHKIARAPCGPEEKPLWRLVWSPSSI